MFVDYVTRGVEAGLVAGLVFGLFVATVVNPMVGYAEAVGHGHDHDVAGHDHSGGEGVVSLAATETVSVLSGVLWAVLLGAVVFGVGFYLLEPLLPGSGRLRSYVLAAAGFVSVSGAPWLVLPPRPGVETALPAATRLALYGGMMVAGALLCLLALVAYDRLRPRGRAVALMVAGLALTPLAVPASLAPTPGVAGDLPPELAAGLVGLIVFGQALLWLCLAATHARLHTDRSHADAATSGDPVAAD
ncbi:CbtA family protein [Haloplanus salilacus]|uniref:CbtA family protein n=1 Tax=Haloplanus salilacus TaxID=2949994 RepID=UPI0030D4029B